MIAYSEHMLVPLVAQVAEIQITIWVTSKGYFNDFETIFGYEI